MLTINSAGTMTIGRASAACQSCRPYGYAKTVAATTAAAAGLGMPTKYRRSPGAEVWMLNRARRMAAADTKMKPVAHPSLSKGTSPHLNASRAGATPNEITSASESNWSPNSLV